MGIEPIDKLAELVTEFGDERLRGHGDYDPVEILQALCLYDIAKSLQHIRLAFDVVGDYDGPVLKVWTEGYVNLDNRGSREG